LLHNHGQITAAGRRKVLKTFFGKSFGASKAKKQSSGVAALMKPDLDRIKTLIEFFPIGKKLRYYPEFKQEIVFDTLVVAYCVNGNFVYSSEAIDRDPEGRPTLFRSGENEVRTPVSALRLFQILVPDTSDLEMKLDYHRRAQIGRGKQFNPGNCISLISNAGGKGVSTVDTEVAQQVEMPDGPYARSNMILLTPDLTTLSVTDQRKRSRTKISAPVTLSLPEDRFSGACIIVDISDGEVRIRVRERGTAMPAMQAGDIVFIETELGEAERRYLIKGTVIRRSTETCVIHLDGQFNEGRFSNFSALDLLELKSGLLNFGK
jgi:hypothetical protein